MRTTFSLLTLTLISFSIPILSQNKIERIENGFSIEVSFDEPIYTDEVNGILTIRDYPDFTDASQTGKFKLPSKTFLIAIPPYSKPDIQIAAQQQEIVKGILPSLQPKAKLLNDSTIVYEEVDYSDAVIENKNQNTFEIIRYGWYREYYCAQVKINTHSLNASTNQITSIKSAKLSIDFGKDYPFSFNENLQTKIKAYSEFEHLFLNAQIADQFAGKQPLVLEDTTGNWINYGSDYLKIGTAQDALFRITKSDLEAEGINTSSFNPKTFRLIESGVELPITVFGQDDNVFNDDDYIQFYGTLNYPKISYRIINAPDEPYNEYLDRYSDTTFYFLTWGLQDGERIHSQNSFTSGLTDSLTYYNYVEHTESNRLFQNFYTDEVNNQTPGWFRNKTWYFLQTVWLYSNSAPNYNFDVTDVVLNKSAKFFYKAVSGGSNITSNAHQVILKVNNVLLDSQSINRNDQLLLTGTLNTNQFITNPNVLTVKNYANGTNPNYLGIDWYDIEYPRTLKFANDSILFSVSEDITSGLKVVKITNATLPLYEIYKVKPFFKKIDSYQVTASEVLFTDTVHAGDTYIVVAPSKIGKPVFYYKKQFINLRNVTTQADYLGITNQKFLQSANEYVNSISTMYAVSKDVISVEDIFDEFSFGYHQPEAIRLFTAITYQNRIEPKPSYLSLIGDADYDYKLYRFKADGVIGGGNYVPSYGNPVSDNWLVVWDENGLPIPQMKVGRIPINTNEELDYYLSKIENNFNERFDEWNKRYMFFSGGASNDSSEIAQLKAVNDQIINTLIRPEPLSGSYTHFYKTTNPLSDFGPYTSDQISNAIDEGSVFISYLGHSGTATWDNSINETVQLKNKVNRNPLITDFGCSTNKFAEPDIVAFGERFLLNNDGQALGYIGNSSLGFTTTSFNLPIYFYEDMFNSETKEVGNAHLASKIRMFQNLGTSSVFRLFALTNTLIGDPAIRIKIPNQPNLKISSSDVLLSNNFLNDAEDSTNIEIVINNFGLKDSSQFNYSIQHSAGGNIIKTFSERRALPNFKDTLNIWISIKDLAGENSLNITLDSSNEINEIYEDDNNLTYNFYVYSTALRDLIKHRIENSSLSQIKILNPSFMNQNIFNIKYQMSEIENFQNFQEFTIPADSFYTNLTLNQLTLNKRYWVRYKLDDQNSVYSNVKSFYNGGSSDYYLFDSTSFQNQTLNTLNFSNYKLSLVPELENISVTSAGFYAGNTCVIAKNGINLLSNSFFAGMGIVVFDDLSLEVDTSAWYRLFNQPGNMQQLVALIDSVPQGKIVAIGVSGDAANNITIDLINAIKSLGSTKIDSLAFRGSWALIGRKGANPGDVIEQIKTPYDGLIYIDSTLTIPGSNGTLETIEIGPSTNWQSATVSQNIPSGSSIQHFAYGIKIDGSVDSLGALNFVNNNAGLGYINPKTYPKIKIKSEFNATPEGVSPELSSFGIDYVGLSELGTNSQVVGVDNDTIPVGGNITLTFLVYNIGESDADSFKVKVDVINQNNSSLTIIDQLVTSLPPNSKRKFFVNYQALDTDSEKRFLISIDSENKVSEYFEDNNFFTMPFYIQTDVIPPSLKITFDETEVVNGDFVSKNPNINIALSDESPIPTDTSAIKIYLNEEPVYYGANSSIISYTINSTNPKFVVEYKPELEDGEYLLRVVGKDPSGNTADSASSEVYFVVSSETKLMQVYNYPNPFINETYFTFRLSQIPEEIKIRIYTIAGRMIKEIVRKSSELNYDLNKIYWDGKDADGDFVANGTYLYKLLMKNDDKVESVTQKLVIIK